MGQWVRSEGGQVGQQQQANASAAFLGTGCLVGCATYHRGLEVQYEAWGNDSGVPTACLEANIAPCHPLWVLEPLPSVPSPAPYGHIAAPAKARVPRRPGDWVILL